LWESARDILNDDWDPLPGTPDDEYDEVVRKIVSMIKGQTTVVALAGVMKEFELGLGDYLLDANIRRRVAEKLIRLRPEGS